MCARRAIRDEDLATFNPEQQDELKELVKAVVKNDLHVDRIVRVGCPIRGTLLASKRLDAYLSVLKWTMDVAGWGIAGEVVDFLGAVAQLVSRRPIARTGGAGAAQPVRPVAARRRVAHSRRTARSPVFGLAVRGRLGADLGQDVDGRRVLLDRQRRGRADPMDVGGARRQGAAMFRLDRGGKVLHTRYFARDRAAEPVFKAVLDDQPDGFERIGPLSWAGTDSSGERARITDTRTPVSRGDRPAVFLIPGFAASTLTSGNELVWPAAMAIATIGRLAFTPGADPLHRRDVRRRYVRHAARASGSHARRGPLSI